MRTVVNAAVHQDDGIRLEPGNAFVQEGPITAARNFRDVNPHFCDRPVLSQQFSYLRGLKILVKRSRVGGGASVLLPGETAAEAHRQTSEQVKERRERFRHFSIGFS